MKTALSMLKLFLEILNIEVPHGIPRVGRWYQSVDYLEPCRDILVPLPNPWVVEITQHCRPDQYMQLELRKLVMTSSGNTRRVRPSRVAWADAWPRTITPISYLAMEPDVLAAAYGIRFPNREPKELIIEGVQVIIL